MGIAGVLFHESALGGPGYEARDDKVWDLLEELAEITNVVIIGSDHDNLDGYDVFIVDMLDKDAFTQIEAELEADAASYLYIDPDGDRLKAAKKAGFLTHRLVDAQLLDDRLRSEKILD